MAGWEIQCSLMNFIGDTAASRCIHPVAVTDCRVMVAMNVQQVDRLGAVVVKDEKGGGGVDKREGE